MDVLRPAISRSAPPRTGCARYSTRLAGGTLPGLARTGASFADAAAEFTRYAEHDRACKPSTPRAYHSDVEAHLLPAFGDQSIESVTPAAIDRWRGSLTALSNRTKNTLLVVMHRVFRRA